MYSGELPAKDPQIVDDVENQRARKATASAQQKECAQQAASKVLICVSVILLELLDHFKTVPAAQQNTIKARKKIAQGLRWFELVPTLEDIRDFVLHAHLDYDKDCQQCLVHFYEELLIFCWISMCRLRQKGKCVRSQTHWKRTCAKVRIISPRLLVTIIQIHLNKGQKAIQSTDSLR